MNDTLSLKRLKEHLARFPPGEILVSRTLIGLLASSGHELTGAPQQGMKAPLLTEVSSLRWEPPMLSYTIQRKGVTPLGSPRTPLQEWSIDLQRNQATCVRSWVAYHVRERADLTRVGSVANEIGEAIFAGHPDRRLRWGRNATVQVLMTKIVPYGSGSMRTVAGHRRGCVRSLNGFWPTGVGANFAATFTPGCPTISRREFASFPARSLLKRPR